VLVDPTTLGKAPKIELPLRYTINDNLIELPATVEEAETITVERGPNIKPIPKGAAPAEDLECELKLKELADVTSRCMPMEQEAISDKCICCGKKADKLVYWGKAY
jgi:prolyl-tRNA synthetase